MILLLNSAEELFQQIRMAFSNLFSMKWSSKTLILIKFYFKKPQPVTMQTVPPSSPLSSQHIHKIKAVKCLQFIFKYFGNFWSMNFREEM
jgi:hypothetical protein